MDLYIGALITQPANDHHKPKVTFNMRLQKKLFLLCKKINWQIMNGTVVCFREKKLEPNYSEQKYAEDKLGRKCSTLHSNQSFNQSWTTNKGQTFVESLKSSIEIGFSHLYLHRDIYPAVGTQQKRISNLQKPKLSKNSK